MQVYIWNAGCWTCALVRRTLSPAKIYIETVLPRTMSPRLGGAGGKKRVVRIGPLNETDVFVSASDEICEIICGT